MKLFTRFTVTIICFFLISFHSKTVVASDIFTGDSTCCDTARIYYVSDSTTTDSCFGSALFYISPDSNCVIKSVTTSDFDTIVWVDSISTFYAKYTIAKGASKSIYGYFLNEWGDTVCSKNIIIYCLDCCDSSMIFSVADSGLTDTCMGMVYFPFDTLCEIVMVRSNLGPDSLMVWDSTHNAYGIPYYLSEGDSIEAFGYFLNENNDTLCIQSIKIFCPEISCCDQIVMTDIPDPSPEGQPCCGTISFDLGECEFSFINFSDLSNPLQTIVQVGPYTFEYCIEIGRFIHLEFYFYDLDGNQICTKVFDKYCEESLGKRSVNNIQSEAGFKIFPNPTATEFKLVLENNYDLISAKLSIFNLNGVRVKSIGLPSNANLKDINIDVSDLNQGVYFVEIQNSESVKRTKISVIR